MDEPSVARLLLESAQRDFVALRVLAGAAEVADTIAGFHAQQACEKSLKAVLSATGVEFRRTHDLASLMDLLADTGSPLPIELQWMDELNPYAVEARYGLVDPCTLDRQHVVRAVHAVLAWAREQLDRRGA